MGENSYLCLSQHRQLPQLFKHQPKALFSLMNAPVVNVCIWGCCRDLLQAHINGGFHSLCPSLIPGCSWNSLRSFNGCRDARTPHLCNGTSLHGTSGTRYKGTSPEADIVLGLCLWASPLLPAGFWLTKHQQDPSICPVPGVCCTRTSCGKSISAPNSHCSLYISFIPAGLKSARDRCKQACNKLLILQKGWATRGFALDSSSYCHDTH